MKKLGKNTKRFFLGFVFLAVLLNFAAAEVDPGPCEFAFFRCIRDPFWFGTTEGLFHCALGYVFCKKYIDPL